MADNSDYSLDTVQKLTSEKNWSQVIDKCNEAMLAIGEDTADRKYLFYRAMGHYETEEQAESLTDLKTLLDNPNIAESLRFDSLSLKANCLFSLEEYQTCKRTLKAAFDLRTDPALYQLINRCNTRLGLPEESPPAADIPRKKTYRHEWYQTNSEIVISIMIKKLTHEDLTYQFKETHLFMEVKLPDNDSFILNTELFDKIRFCESKVTILSTKIEIRLLKATPTHWDKLERPETSSGPARKMQTFCPNGSSAQDPQKFPTSAKAPKDWDKLAADITKEEKEEKPEGDAALNQFFQQIYGQGSDEQKKAMMKSFQESGGTVLSTNWDEVGKEKVEMKPPDGMEYKKYDQ